MLCENDINGLIKGSIRIRDGEEFMFYDITSRQNLIRITGRRELEFEDVKTLFFSWQDAVSEAERYLISPMFFLCDPEYIYYNFSTNRTEWIFYPRDEEPDFPDGLNVLSEFLLEKVNHKDADAVDVAYQFYRDAKEDDFLLNNTIRMIEKANARGRNFAGETESPSLMLADAISEEEDFFRPSEEKEGLSGVFSKIGSLFSGIGKGKKTVTEEGSVPVRKEIPGSEEYWMEMKEDESKETMLLGRREAEERRELTEIRSKKVYSLSNLPVIAGKLKTEVDIVIDDPSVSRIHARFFEENENVWIEDLNSTNGVSVNDMPLEANEKVPLSPGDRILIGAVEFLYN